MSYCLLGLTSGAGVLPHDPVDAAVGDTVMFTTSLDPTQTPLSFTSILWKFGSKDIITSADTNITKQTTLRVRYVILFSLKDTDLILIMYSPTEMISDALVSSSTQLPEEGTSLNVTCDASGSVSTREWMKNGSPLNSSENIMFYHQNQVLSFISLSRKDSGRYSCNISNPVSSQEDTHYMVVTYGPENIEISGSKEVQVQTAFRLSCSAESVPAASYVWIKNGTIIADSFEFTENLSELSDSGEYICAPTNGLTTLNVYEQVSNVRITTNNTDLVEFNDTVRLSCSASGSSLSFLWFNDSVEVTASDRVRITDGGATLTIVTVLRYDQGSYTCEVSNPVSSSTSDKVLLFVSYGPEGVTVSPSAEYYGEGSVVSFSCSADSRPEAQFRWFINGEMLFSTGAQINLVMEQSGNYSCQAFNRKTLRYTTSPPEEISVLSKNTICCVNFFFMPFFNTKFTAYKNKTHNKKLQDLGNSSLLKVNNLLMIWQRHDLMSYFTNCSFWHHSILMTSNILFSTENITNISLASSSNLPVEGTSVNLTCDASGSIFIREWMINGIELKPSENIVFYEGKRVLSFRNLTRKDSGRYTCRISNPVKASRTVYGSATGLSTGAVIGITVASLAAVAGAAAGAFYMFIHK
uniref:Ig-like domain-containing protein n=1 Tax=Neogobius melanostomus TaxID=47308 RepID=A0A8C6WM00_9GOBI